MMTHTDCSHTMRRRRFPRPTGQRPGPEISGVKVTGATASSAIDPFPDEKAKAKEREKARGSRSESPGSSPQHWIWEMFPSWETCISSNRPWAETKKAPQTVHSSGPEANCSNGKNWVQIQFFSSASEKESMPSCTEPHCQTLPSGTAKTARCRKLLGSTWQVEQSES